VGLFWLRKPSEVVLREPQFKGGQVGFDENEPTLLTNIEATFAEPKVGFSPPPVRTA
jgi:hypothetical protein